MIVVITGASAGIGKALSEELHQRGARLVLSARRIDRLEELNRSLGGKHLCVQTDVSKREECEALIAKSITHFGRIDTLVCNAGFGLYIPVAETSPQDVRRLFETNV
jgi:NADP-dependent 3-hydroxy acid dehydrogenase YdfG